METNPLKITLLLVLGMAVNLIFAQSEWCKAKPKFQLSSNSYKEDYNINLLDCIESMKGIASASGNPRTVVIQFYFDELNKFHKTSQEFKELLMDSLKSMATDIQIEFKIQKNKGVNFLNDGENEKLSINHLNALVYSQDKNVLLELFGQGNESRIDTTTSRKKSFSREFVKIKSVHSEETGYLYLMRPKLSGKGFSCDPNEDIDLIKMLVKIYDKKFNGNCEKLMFEMEKKELKEANDSLSNKCRELGEENKKYADKLKTFNNSKLSLVAGLDYLFGETSINSQFIGSDIKFKTAGFSNTAGINYFPSGTNSKTLFLSAGINASFLSYSMVRLINHTYINAENGFNALSSLSNYDERITSTSLMLPMSVGYQYREENWPIFFQVSAGVAIGMNKLVSTNGSGMVDYTRVYTDYSGIVVDNQPELGLVNNVALNGTPTYNANTALAFGGFANFKINYEFSKTSPFVGFLQGGYTYLQTKTSSNNSAFITSELGELNSVLNSTPNLKHAPFFVGLGISLEVRKKIKLK